MKEINQPYVCDRLDRDLSQKMCQYVIAKYWNFRVLFLHIMRGRDATYPQGTHEVLLPTGDVSMDATREFCEEVTQEASKIITCCKHTWVSTVLCIAQRRAGDQTIAQCVDSCQLPFALEHVGNDVGLRCCQHARSSVVTFTPSCTNRCLGGAAYRHVRQPLASSYY